ncbi:MAG: hypothetical protein EAZ16_14565 [Sphingobacteriales bacterium]|nr:MAG: hypothetical protein EAZ16_14565 [Sphingobacteriales bacterium]
MQQESSKYDAFIVKNILANNEFAIQVISDLEIIHTRSFVQPEYAEIEKLIKEKNIESIKKFRKDEVRRNEYLDIMTFSDQDKNKYIVTIYDSDELWQDPQVIEIYKL